MYILKNALLNMTRRKGKNILIGIIITIITISSCISLTINKSGNLAIKNPRHLKYPSNLIQWI